MYAEYAYHVYPFLKGKSTFNAQVIKSKYNYASPKILQELSTLIREEIESDRVRVRDPIEFMTKIHNRFQCHKIMSRKNLSGLLCQYSMLADTYNHVIKENESVFIVACACNEETFAHLFMGIEQPHIWNIVPTIGSNSSLALYDVREYYRELLRIAGVTQKEYQHPEVVIARYLFATHQ